MVIFEKSVTSRKKHKANFTKLLKKKFVENAEKYAFLDPFAGEFDYADRTIDFSGAASDQELIDGVVNSIRELAQELGILQQLQNACHGWSDKYASQLENFSVIL
jgi:ribosome assembly protein YihI (activator of Der GTPase)